MGRKKLHIDWNIVDNLLKAQCDGATIARMIGMHPDTLYTRCEKKFKLNFTAYAQQKKMEGRELLRATQYDMAVIQKDKTMLVWLGKQYLGQKDRQDRTTNDKDITEKTIIVTDSKAAENLQKLLDGKLPEPKDD